MPHSFSALNNFIDPLPYGPNKGRPHSEISGRVLCTFTDIINAKKHFVRELVARREEQVHASKTEAVLLVLVCS